MPLIFEFPGYRLSRPAMAMLASTNHFIPSLNDARILFKISTNGYAEIIAFFLTAAVVPMGKRELSRQNQ